MRERQLQSGGGVVTVGFILTLAYGLAYALMVKPVTFVDDSVLGAWSGHIGPEYVPRAWSTARWPNRVLEEAFSPLNWLDQKVRPSLWEIPPVKETRKTWREITTKRSTGDRHHASPD
jgi:hypothetical protein